jgi:hypothetical protein
VNDVWVSVRAVRFSNSTDPPGVLRVQGVVLHCQDPVCATYTSLFAGDLGTLAKKQAATLRVEWDPANHRFIFTRDGLSSVGYVYTVPDAARGGFVDVKRLDANLALANCATEPRPTALMDALFDDVYVNESAAPAP